jgi:hypothetical protein
VHAALLAAGGIQTFGSVIGFILALLIGYASGSIAKARVEAEHCGLFWASSSPSLP